MNLTEILTRIFAVVGAFTAGAVLILVFMTPLYGCAY